MAHLAHYDEAHPLPFRITHWINLVAMVFLIISGCIIHFPFVPGVMGIARGAHIFFGFVLTINCLVRVIMAFVVKSAPTGGTRAVVKDYKTWLPQADNRHQLGAWIKYYLFMKKDHPQSAKLGVPQKISYLLIPVLILIMFVTGLCIWGPTMGATAGLTAALGGTMAVRIIHYFMMFVFVIFIFIHVYLANIEGFAPSKLMFFGKEHEGLHYDVERHVVLAEEQK
ncbi:cytochrome b/b6 domain-containing protein [Slackia exigua]|uniref:Ni/Fe-hydrogenase, b-type cytochrome subunit n=1 Tax=Slackia exigua (strain ATCC 700122 / DSM 15923 / CIP 105133 / JCM 11022 / KCTC 5966 / S-7) TaxID=649764 RepID=D0WFL1_SLAES|nr:cytochrome b/b6 domain-containing protein [Slackia exigua]EEZ61274.1 putative Ni/Fe-hydrogenase, b-type cytochrome subunit [Slackia exigua ATCC 700122]STN98926.1 Quinone-reactive Ni/Fe-hydrogenase B-type cytochrome subunit [Slackia exigua]